MFEKMTSQLRELSDDFQRALYNLKKDPQDEKKPMQSMTRISQIHRSVEEAKSSKTGNEDVDFIVKRLGEIFGG